MSNLLEIKGLSKHFMPSGMWLLTGAKKIKAVDNVSFNIEEGTVFGLVGESGCGKTTLGRLILNLIKPSSGSVLLDGKDVLQFSKKDIHEYRRQAQIIFQNPFASLNPRRNVFENLSTGYQVYKIGNLQERREWLEILMSRVGLDPKYLDRYPHQFSGGQRQRLGIARVLTLKPKIVIADEPVSALDASVQAQILNLLRELQKEFNFTMILISHDLRLIYHMSDRIGVMYMGRMVERAGKEDLYNNPLHPYTKALISSAPSLDPKQGLSSKLISGEVWDKAPPENGCAFFNRCPMAGDECREQIQELKELGNDHAVACWRVS
ncbi:MAG: ABC transporter ATP-binding protein [Spirochaetaceae bacterium]|nr:ABC transporter ATP-binding protein [Spirochaetaceae bacterium]